MVRNGQTSTRVRVCPPRMGPLSPTKAHEGPSLAHRCFARTRLAVPPLIGAVITNDRNSTETYSVAAGGAKHLSHRVSLRSMLALYSLGMDLPHSEHSSES